MSRRRKKDSPPFENPNVIQLFDTLLKTHKPEQSEKLLRSLSAPNHYVIHKYAIAGSINPYTMLIGMFIIYL